MNRVFICSDAAFPRASAGGNYIQYLAKALIGVGWRVIVISHGRNRVEDFNPKSKAFIYQNIEYNNFEFQQSKLKTILAEDNACKKSFEKQLVEYGVCNSDYAIYYGENLDILKCLNSYFSPNHISVCRVEMKQPFQYKLGQINPKYRKYQNFVKYIFSNVKRTIPISRFIQAYDHEQRCKTLLLPIMADPYEYIDEVENRDREKVKIIYSGAKKTNFEDAAKNMLIAFYKFLMEQPNKVEFHITGTSLDRIREILGNESDILNKLKDSLYVYGWMEYNHLIDLYKDMDFLFLARQNNITTQANFPSKVPEALGFGIIPICSDVGDYTKYYLQDGIDSIIFSGCDVDDCLNALHRALNLSASQRNVMRKNARNSAINKFYYQLWADKISEFLKDGYL